MKKIVALVVEVPEQSGDSIQSKKIGKTGIKDSIKQRLETSYKSITRALSFPYFKLVLMALSLSPSSKGKPSSHLSLFYSSSLIFLHK